MNIFGFLQKLLKPAAKAALNEAADKSGGRSTLRGRRPPVTFDPHRDLSPCDHTRHREISQYLFRKNPIAKRGIENLCSFVTSEGFAPRATCQDDKHRAYLQKWLDAWWAKNQWDRRLPKRYRTACVEGEWFFWRKPPNAKGISRMCYIRPERVSEVEVDELDAERFHQVKLSPALEFVTDGKRSFRHELTVADEECPDGEVLYFQLNALVGQTRGFSDLLSVADWLDQLDTVILTEVERVQYQRAFSWFVKLTGVETGKLLEAVERIQAEGPPGPGGVLVHNETEEWDAKSPELHLEDSVEFIKFLMHLSFGGLYMPEHYYATGGDVNKATSANMDTPIFAVARDRKKDLKEFFRLAIALDLKQAREMGVFAASNMHDDGCFDFEIHSKDPDRSAYDLLGEVLTTFGSAMQLGQAEGWITPVEAAQAFRMAANGMGLGDFPGVDLESLQKAAQAKLEAQKSELSQQFPLREPQRQELAEAAGDEPKEKLLGDLAKIVRRQARSTVSNATAAGAFAAKMTKEISAELLIGQPAGGSISELHVEGTLRRFRPVLEEGFPVSSLPQVSGRAYVSRFLAGRSLEIPAGAAGAVVETLAADQFEKFILDKMRSAQAEGASLEDFAKSLADAAELAGDKMMAKVAHAEQRSQRAAEELMFRDIDAANPGRLRIRFTRVGASYCGQCTPLSGHTFAMSDQQARSLYRTPKHKGCRCVWAPEVDSDALTVNFLKELADLIDQASAPVRAMYRT